MDNCLEQTGIGMRFTTTVAVLLVMLAVVIFYKRKKIWRNASILTVLLLVVAPILMPLQQAYAATTCNIPASQPDTTTGVLGATQQINVLANDTPTPGSTFIPSTLELYLLEGHVLGATISNNNKTVITPDEGQYDSVANGVVQFQPEPDFVGQASGVGYSIKDTAGNTTKNTYTPLVTTTTTPPPVGLCSSAPITLQDHHFSVGGPTAVFSSNIDTVSPALSDLDSTTDGQKIVGLSGYMLYISNDAGATWVEQTDLGNDLDSVSMSNDGQIIVAGTSTGTVRRSTNGGTTWTTHSTPNVSNTYVTISNDGTTYVLSQSDENDASIGRVYTSTNATSWLLAHTLPDQFIRDMEVSDNGNVMRANAVSRLDFSTSLLVSSTDGGASWSDQAMPDTGILALIASSNGTNLAVISATADSVYTSSNGGASWTQQVSAGVRPWARLAGSADGQTLLASSYNESSYLSTDGGLTWTELTTLPQADWSGAMVSPDGSTLIASVNSSVYELFPSYISHNSGSTWASFTRLIGIDRDTVDLDSGTAGVQQTLHRVNGPNDWTAVYDPITDTLTITYASDTYLFFGSDTFTYSANTTEGCSTTPGQIVLESNNT